MIVKGKDLKRLLRGAVITLEFDRDLGWHAGRTYAVQTKGGRPQIARMLCREWWGPNRLWEFPAYHPLAVNDDQKGER